MRLLLLGLLLFATGCVAKHRQHYEAWRFNHCAHNVDHWVCDCTRHYEVITKNGTKVTVCE